MDLGQAAAVLDKSNANRTLELALHTLTNYNATRNCSELILEMVHRYFKDWEGANRDSNAHLTDVESDSTNDWM